MCSIGEDDFGDEGGLHAMVPDPVVSASEEVQICKKCNETPSVVKLSYKEAQCRRCFLNFVRHKFRATLGASKIVKKGSNVLVLADGSAESQALLDMIRYGLDDEMFKRLHANIAGVLYIDDLFLHVTEKERTDLLEKLRNSLAYLNLNLVYTSVATKEVAQFENYVFNAEAEEEFKMKLSKLKTLTAQQDYLKVLKDEIVCMVADRMECPFVFTAEISSNIAMKLLTDIALGRGASTAQDVAFSDDRNQILRPMKDVTPIEVDHYLRLNELSPVVLPRFGQSRGDAGSIQNLTAAFVKGLQSQFASTVSTVSKTGEKMKAKSFTPQRLCKLCKAEIDCNASETLFAVEYSRVVSMYSKEQDPKLIEEKAKAAVDGIDEFRSNLCHGCRNIFLNSNVSDDLETYVSDDLKT